MKVIRDIAGYNMSEDYVLLFELAQKHSVVCEVQNEECRDIAATLFTEKTYQISVRGTAYIYARTMEEFIEQCKKYKVKFIIPCYWPGA